VTADLDPQETIFVAAYLKSNNASEAYRKCNPKAAKWKPQSVHVKASEMMARDKVKVRLAALQDKVVAAAVEKAAISKAWVIEKLIENVDRAMQHAPVRRKSASGGEEEIPGEFVYNGSVANKALELLGKEVGMFVDRKEVGGPGDFARMSDEELDDFLAEPIVVPSSDANGRAKH